MTIGSVVSVRRPSERTDLPDYDELMWSTTVSADTAWTPLRYGWRGPADTTLSHTGHATLTGRVDRHHTEPVLGPRYQ